MSPASGRAAVLEELGAPPRIAELPLLEPGPGEIVVAIERATVCGSDLHIWEGELGDAYTVPLPLVLGHEAVGRVLALGLGSELDSVGRPLAAGDRVVWANEPCGHCPTCTVRRAPTLCPQRRLISLVGCAEPPYLTGTFAEYCHVPAGAGRLRVPDEVESGWASAASCALRTVVDTVAAVGRIDFLDTVVVQGAGPLGLFATALVSTFGPRRLIVIGDPPERLELARAWGATDTVSVAEHDRGERLRLVAELCGGASVAFELCGARGAPGEGVELLGPGGRYAISGTIGGPPQELDVARITTRGLRLIGSMSGDVDAYYKALEFLRSHRDRFDWDLLLGRSYGLDQVPEALAAMKELREIKPVIDPSLPGTG